MNQYGGEIYILPAVGTAAQNDIEPYRKNLMRFDMDVPAYELTGTLLLINRNGVLLLFKIGKVIPIPSIFCLLP